LREIFADMHIHIGRSQGRAIKITASPELTLKNILFQEAPRKGLEMVGIVDAGSIMVAAEIEEMLRKGELEEQPQGGFLAANGVLMIAGAEVESREGVHWIIFLPFLHSIKSLQKYLRSRVRNMTLSTQKANATAIDLLNLSYLLEGIFCPAHAFTPHKGAYGFWTDSLADRMGHDLAQVKVLELGLSADSLMADMIAETSSFTFLSNSDAHSLPNIGREYNLLRMKQKNFAEFRYCLENYEGRRVLANYGMDPLMGKYHRSFCLQCERIAAEAPPVQACANCGSENLVAGVYDRIVSIRDYSEPRQPLGRAPYYCRVPLQKLPGIGPKTLEKLRAGLGSEIDICENANQDDISKIAGETVAALIMEMRKGRLDISPGGGGRYGKVKKNNCKQ